MSFARFKSRGNCRKNGQLRGRLIYKFSIRPAWISKRIGLAPKGRATSIDYRVLFPRLVPSLKAPTSPVQRIKPSTKTDAMLKSRVEGRRQNLTEPRDSLFSRRGARKSSGGLVDYYPARYSAPGLNLEITIPSTAAITRRILEIYPLPAPTGRLLRLLHWLFFLNDSRDCDHRVSDRR